MVEGCAIKPQSTALPAEWSRPRCSPFCQPARCAVEASLVEMPLYSIEPRRNPAAPDFPPAWSPRPSGGQNLLIRFTVIDERTLSRESWGSGC